MQAVALISDIHANLAALDAVLDEIDSLGVGHVICCGDVVGYGPHPRECVARLRERKIPCVLGNHDLYTLQTRNNNTLIQQADELWADPVWAGILHAVDQLQEEDFDWLLDLPTFLTLSGVVVGHAAMHDSDDWPYLDADEDVLATLQEMENRDFKLGFFGHTHGQEWFSSTAKGAIRRVEKPNSTLRAGQTTAVVVGSVGQPRTGDPRAAWTLWTPKTRHIEFRRTTYPLKETAKAIHDFDLPRYSAERLKAGI